MFSSICRNAVRELQSFTMEKSRHLIAVCQMTSNHDMEANLKIADALMQQAKQRNAEVFLLQGRW